MAAKDAIKASSTIGLKNFVIAPLTKDDESGVTYGDVQKVAGSIEATITPENNDPDVQYADDIEYEVVYPDPELTFKTKLADVPLAVQKMIFGNRIDANGVLLRGAADKPPYFAAGFKSEKSDHTFRYVWLFKVRAKPMSEEYGTKEGATLNRKEPEIEWTAIKRTYDGEYQAIADEGMNNFSDGDTFLGTVYTPGEVPADT